MSGRGRRTGDRNERVLKGANGRSGAACQFGFHACRYRAGSFSARLRSGRIRNIGNIGFANRVFRCGAGLAGARWAIGGIGIGIGIRKRNTVGIGFDDEVRARIGRSTLNGQSHSDGTCRTGNARLADGPRLDSIVARRQRNADIVAFGYLPRLTTIPIRFHRHRGLSIHRLPVAAALPAKGCIKNSPAYRTIPCRGPDGSTNPKAGRFTRCEAVCILSSSWQEEKPPIAYAKVCKSVIDPPW